MSLPETRARRRFGTSDADPEYHRLCFDRLEFAWQNGAIRHVRRDGIELLRGLSVVVRDANWGTHEATARLDDITRGRATVALRYEAVVGEPAAPDLELSLAVRVDAAGLEAQLALQAHTRFPTCRSGLCVLLPIAGLVGRPAQVVHASGAETTGRFPRHISPGQPFFDIARLSFTPEDGAPVRLDFEGDVFEMEDQRNWSDASFKIYNRPLAWPTPYALEPGERVTQRIQLCFDDLTSPVA